MSEDSSTNNQVKILRQTILTLRINNQMPQIGWLELICSNHRNISFGTKRISNSTKKNWQLYWKI